MNLLRPSRHTRVLMPIVALASIALVVTWALDALADSYSQPDGVPRLMPYRGHLELSGAPVTSRVNAGFELYDAASGGTRLWGPEAHAITPTNGEFAVTLGSTVPLDTRVLAGGDAYVQIAIDGTVLSSRQRLGAAPYALRSADGIPLGAIVDWVPPPGPLSIPVGFQLCDGSEIIDARSPFVGQSTPDLRSRFTMGGRVSEVGTTGGSQDVAVSHTHAYSGSTSGLGGGYGWTNLFGGSIAVPHGTLGHTHTYSGTTASAEVTFDNRPPFFTVLKLMRIR